MKEKALVPYVETISSLLPKTSRLLQTVPEDWEWSHTIHI